MATRRPAGASRKRRPPRARPARGRSPGSRGVRVTPAAAPPGVDDGLVRLNRFLASAGICSRRAADELIAEGRVTVGGEVVTELGRRVDPFRDEVCIDEQRVRPEKPVYVLFNKPKNVVCTNARGDTGRRVVDHLQGVKGRLYTAGRLDADSEGLVLLTNDGAFAQRITHPRYGVPKTYAVLIRGRIDEETVRKVRRGVWLAEGRTQGATVRVERRSRDRSYLKVTLREGKNREIRRIFARLGHPVLALKRVRIGNLSLHRLRTGEFRFLARHEVDELLRMTEEENV